MAMRVRISVLLKPGILDPQGKAVEHSLHELGLPAKDVRIGKLIELQLPASTVEEAENMAQKLCHQLLVNPVMEQARIEVLPCG